MNSKRAINILAKFLVNKKNSVAELKFLAQLAIKLKISGLRLNTVRNKDYIPALRYDFLTKLYDKVIFWTIRESTFKSALLIQVNPKKNFKILDLGCGTATLTIQLKEVYSDVEIIGIDGDPNILAMAAKKVKSSGVDIQLDRGMSFNLPYPDSSFDQVISSLMFHHLSRERKLETLREILRILKPEGELHIADWGKAQNVVMRIAFLAIQFLDGFNTTMDNIKGMLPMLCKQSGFTEIKETSQYITIFGPLSLYKAKKSKNSSKSL